MINPPNPHAIHGKKLITRHEQSAETRGDVHIVCDHQVNHGEPPLKQAFGILGSRVYNEGNSNKSRREDIYLDTENLKTVADATWNGLDQPGMPGAEKVKVVKGTVDVTGASDSDQVIEDLLAQGYKIVESKVESEDGVHAQRVTTLVLNWEERVDENRADPAADGAPSKTFRRIVSGSDPWPVRDLKTINLIRQHLGYDKWLETEKVLSASSWPTLVSMEEEPTTGKRVLTTKTLHATAPSTTTNGLIRKHVSVKQIGQDRWLRVEREIDATILTTTYQEWHPVEYIFPAYLDEEQPFIVMQAGEEQTLINTLRSSGQRLKVPCLFEITYHAILPTIEEVFQFKPVDISLRTPDGVISEQGVLTDGAVVTFLLDTSDAKRQELRDAYQSGKITWEQYVAQFRTHEVEFEFPPSSPTTSEYKDMMGSVVLIADDMMRWKYNLYRRVKVWMRLPDLATNLSGSIGYA